MDAMTTARIRAPRALHRGSRGLLLVLAATACVAPPPPPPAMQPADITGRPQPAVMTVRDDGTPAAQDFSIAVEPYAWAAGISGTAGLGRGGSADVDVDFQDLLDNLEAGMMLAAEVRIDEQIGLLGDITWLDVGDEVTLPRTNVSAEGSVEMVHGQVSAFWRPPGQEQVIMDFLAGARLVDVRVETEVGQFSGSRSETLIDPVVGMRATIPLGDSFQMVLLGDLGGFGVGTDLSYQVLATVGWAISRNIGVGLGWRQLGIDFEEDELAMDVDFGGPLFGMRVAF
jgi:hypothetical protein